MPQRLFCLREGEGDAVHFTDEHVFPAALGGNVIVKDGSCDGCNHGACYCRDAACEMLASMVRACSDSGAFKSAACRMYFWAAAVSPELRAISPA